MTTGDFTALTPFPKRTIGPTVPGHELAIVEPETAVPTFETGKVGEIAARYADNSVCSRSTGAAETTVAKDRNGWLLTEDLEWADEADYLAFEGRTLPKTAGRLVRPTLLNGQERSSRSRAPPHKPGCSPSILWVSIIDLWDRWNTGGAFQPAVPSGLMREPDETDLETSNCCFRTPAGLTVRLPTW